MPKIPSRRAWILPTIALLVFQFSGFGITPSHAGAANASKNNRVIFVAGQVGIPFYTSVECGAKAAAAKYHVNLQWTGATDWDISKEMPFISAAMAQRPRVVIFSPTDSTALVPVTQRMKKQGIIPLTVDAPLAKPVDLASFQSNHYLGGVAAGKATLQMTHRKGTYLVIGLRPGLPDIGGRINGFVNTVKKVHGVKVLSVIYPGTDSTKSAQMVSAAIRANPDLTAVYATHEAAATGAAAALKETRKQGKIKLIAFDADPQQVSDLKRGVYDALVVQQPYNMGYNPVKLASELISGQVKQSQVKHDEFLPFVVATRSNVNNPSIAKYYYQTHC